MPRGTAVIGTIPSDSHTWNLVYLQWVLKEHGFEVWNLGCCTAMEEFIRVVAQVQPDFAAVSTINGHGVLEGPELARSFRENLLTRLIPLVIGGRLGCEGEAPADLAEKLRAAGFTEAFLGEDDGMRLSAFLQALTPPLPAG